jgi:predicted amidophosphoribosyltransferase
MWSKITYDENNNLDKIQPMKCDKCGIELNRDYKFCQECGNQLKK